MKYDILYNHISPITGRLNLSKGYITMGDLKGISYESPLLQYLKNDFLNLVKRVDELFYLDEGAILVGNKYNIAKPVKLGAAVFPLPDVSALGLSFINNIPIPNPTFNPASPMDWLMSGPWLPQTFVGSTDSDLSNPKAVVSSSLAMNQIRTAKNFKLFDNASFIVASKTVNFAWDNPAYLLAKINPKLQAVLSLYDLDNSYTFTKAQSLGELDTGLLKNTSAVDALGNKTGTLSKAISGEDYVNTADIPIGNLVIIDPLYPTIPNNKLIAPITDFKIRKNKDKEFEKEADKINVLDGIASTFSKLALTSIAAGSLIKISNSFSELVPAIKGTDYIVPDDINTKFDDLVKIIKILFGIKSTVDFFTIANDQVSNLNKVVKTIGGVKDTIDIIEVTSSQAKNLSNAVKSAVGVAQGMEIVDVVSKAASLAGNAASLVEIEEQIAALAGVQAISTLVTILGFIGVVAGGKAYGDYIRGQSLNVKNSWKETDLNDESHNAVGDFEFRYPSGYSSDSRGKGTLWFDSKGRKPDSNNYHEKQAAKAEGGLRIFSWDSGGDSIGFDSPLAPVHIGIFGYQNKRTNVPLIPNPTPTYKGFIFRSEFNNDGSSDNYRYPTKFGLYDVTRKISNGFISLDLTGAVKRWGWSNIIPIFEYDYTNFNFYKPVNILNLSVTKSLNIPVMKSIDIPSNFTTGAMFFCDDL